MLLVVSLKNVNERTVFISRRYHNITGPVCTDENGKALTWKDAAIMPSHSSGPIEVTPSFPLEPGCAVAESAELGDLVDISQPGNYTIIAGLFWVPFGGVTAAPVKFSFGKTPIVPSKPEAVKNEPVPLTGSFASRWRAMLALAGKPRDALLLESLISPVDPRAADLVVSVKNVGRTTAPGQRAKDERLAVPSGLDASDYGLFVKDASGNCLPLLDTGRTWLAEDRLGTKPGSTARTPAMDGKRFIRLGEAVGFVFPLREMFDLRVGDEYEVLVSLPRYPEDSEPLVAGPVKVQIIRKYEIPRG